MSVVMCVIHSFRTTQRRYLKPQRASATRPSLRTIEQVVMNKQQVFEVPTGNNMFIAQCHIRDAT